MKCNLYVFKVIALIGLCFPGLAFSNQMDVATLFKAWSQVESADKLFTEEQFDPLLEISQNKSGVMHYRAPNFLEQHYRKPFEGKITFSDNVVKIDFPNRKLELSIENSPEITLFSRTFLNILNGRLALVKKDFQLVFLDEENNHWKLRLIPINQLKKQIQEVLLVGDKTEIQSILFTQTSGDWRKLSLQTLPTNSTLLK
ncbi:outer membrane lipoprotein carrier protein LolA [Thiomicrorhabdus sp.]|uniref:LolA family protein n=1 Tax=Thiomicrorhabdus sp. TaxID=2039724 RepID=UPI002AA6A9FB|nr:outer membrane lipoprotein carrier protein LolA [Thiomicrorhabdus sp.]